MLLLRREYEAIVNHQLCITNTFEQVFKEKMLKLYKKVRYLCNTHGYPFTKNIHSKYLANLNLSKNEASMILFTDYLSRRQ